MRSSLDHALAKHYGFTGEELDFVVNYDINDNLQVVWNNSSIILERQMKSLMRQNEQLRKKHNISLPRLMNWVVAA
jgi:hypothetical protein